MSTRRWIFRIDDFDGHTVYVDDRGREIDYTEATPVPISGPAVDDEAGRRARLWEDRHCACAATVTAEVAP